MTIRAVNVTLGQFGFHAVSGASSADTLGDIKRLCFLMDVMTVQYGWVELSLTN